MRLSVLKPSLIAALSLGIASSALAQGGVAYGPNDSSADRGDDSVTFSYPAGNIPQPQAYAYERQVQRYRDQQAQYQDLQAGWRAQQDAYDVRRDTYDSDWRAFEYERANYDALYGAGAWERRYGR
jgi:hypothetical protein